jgi:hypothetical protein
MPDYCSRLLPSACGMLLLLTHSGIVNEMQTSIRAATQQKVQSKWPTHRRAYDFICTSMHCCSVLSESYASNSSAIVAVVVVVLVCCISTVCIEAMSVVPQRLQACAQ